MQNVVITAQGSREQDEDLERTGNTVTARPRRGGHGAQSLKVIYWVKDVDV